MREDRPTLGGHSFCYVNVPQRWVHRGRKKAHIKLLSIIFSPTEDYEEMQPAKYSSICRHSWKLNYANSHLARFIWAFKEKRGWGKVVWSTARAHAGPIERDNTIHQCGQSAGASFVAGFSIGLTHFDSFPLSTFLTHIHLTHDRKHLCWVLASANACDICECTLQCGQAELKQLMCVRHASNMPSPTR